MELLDQCDPDERERKKNNLLAAWKSGQESYRKFVLKTMELRRLDSIDIYAVAYRRCFDELAKLDILIANVCRRRDAVLREIERRRDTLARRLREETDAEFRAFKHLG